MGGKLPGVVGTYSMEVVFNCRGWELYFVVGGVEGVDSGGDLFDLGEG